MMSQTEKTSHVISYRSTGQSSKKAGRHTVGFLGYASLVTNFFKREMRNNTNKGRGKKIHVSVYKGSIAAIQNLSRTEEPAKAGTCARDRRALQQLALNVHIKHSDLTCYSK